MLEVLPLLGDGETFLLGDGETLSPGAWVSVHAGNGVGLFMNLSPIRNFLLNRQFFF